MRLSSFDYNLPKELIAQKPATPSDHSRLLIYNRQNQTTQSDFFYHLPNYLGPHDVLVFNNTKVIPARLILTKPSGGKIEIFLLKPFTKNTWRCLVKGKISENTSLTLANYGPVGKIIKKLANGQCLVDFVLNGKKLTNFLNHHGQTPLPPYIKTKDTQKTRQAYQTVFAKKEGSVAAPTAGLHFTHKLLTNLKKKGVQLEFITLHVGLGTFQPVKTKNIKEHQMHKEYVAIDKATAKRLNKYKKECQRIIAVGTTSCRALEALSDKKGYLKSAHKEINIFIYPGYKFKFINSLITNFHLPKSSLLMLVSALVGRKSILKTYNEAIKNHYRFYSFGDAMWIT